MPADDGFYYPGDDPESPTSHLESLRSWWGRIGYIEVASIVFVLFASLGVPLPLPSTVMTSLPFYVLYLLVVLLPVHVVLGGLFAGKLWGTNRNVGWELVLLIGTGIVELVIFLVYVFPFVHLLVFERPI